MICLTCLQYLFIFINIGVGLITPAKTLQKNSRQQKSSSTSAMSSSTSTIAAKQSSMKMPPHTPADSAPTRPSAFFGNTSERKQFLQVQAKKAAKKKED